jgi:hypothetical protein
VNIQLYYSRIHVVYTIFRLIFFKLIDKYPLGWYILFILAGLGCFVNSTICEVVSQYGDAVYSSWQLCTYRHGCKEVYVNLLVRKIIYDYMYHVDLENNERLCEYSAIL